MSDQLQRLERKDRLYENFSDAGASLPGGGGLTPKNLPLVLMCYRAGFGDSAEMSSTMYAESSTENVAHLAGPVSRKSRGPKFNHF